jgi:LPXTG-motif cell wall-anchored protein
MADEGRKRKMQRKKGANLMKNLFKKISAILMAAIMVLAMASTAFAADAATTTTGSITVTGLTANDNTTLKVYKVVGFDEANSDWTIESWAQNHVTNTNHVVNIDWEALKSVNPLPTPVQEISVPANSTSYSIDGLEIGAYMIIATGDHTTYNVMGEAPYGYDANNLIVPAAKTINAKSSDYQLTKTLVNGDQIFVAKGEKVKFNIDTTFPSYALDAENREFWIKDTPTGMKITEIKVLVNGVEVGVDDAYTLDKKLATTEAVTVNFKGTYIGDDNKHAGQSVHVEVTGVITDDTNYTNKAETNKASKDSNVEGKSGSITINKTDDSKEKKSLKGATFQIKKQGENDPIQFVKTDTGIYTMDTSDTDKTGKTAVTDVEATEGTVLVKGLGAGTYVITETKAPKGYSINKNIKNVTLTKESTATQNVTLSVTDTKLGALPSTGGMGTYLFTIIGVVVMAGAAGAFFISRRKGSEE